MSLATLVIDVERPRVERDQYGVEYALTGRFTSPIPPIRAGRIEERLRLSGRVRPS